MIRKKNLSKQTSSLERLIIYYIKIEDECLMFKRTLKVVKTCS